MNLTKTAYAIALSIFAIGLAADGYSQPFLTNGLLAHYPFNGNADDVSGNGTNANVQGMHQFLSEGAVRLIGDEKLVYSGGGYVGLPNYGNLNSGFTLSIWVGGETNHGNGPFAEYYVFLSDNTSRHMWIGQYDFFIQDAGTFGSIPLAITNYSAWKHLVMTYSPGDFSAYLNGVRLASTNVTINPFPVVNSAIGRHWWNNGASSSARMTMDVRDFRIFNRALSTNEVLQLYANELRSEAALVKAVKPSFSNLAVGASYQLQTSSDLNSWTNHGGTFVATNSSVVYSQYFDVDDWNQFFFRLQVAP